MAIIFFLLAILFSALHIYGCKKKDTRLQMLTKPFLVPSMTLTCVFMFPDIGNMDSGFYPVILAMILYTLGDVMLMLDRGRKLLVSGMVSFALGHVVISHTIILSGVGVIPLLISSVIWFGLLAFVFFPRLDPENRMTPYLKAYSVIIAIYGIILSSSNFGGKTIAHILAIFGVGMFALSDYFIAMRITDGKIRKTRVMVTYIFAVALILSSLLLLFR